jgi:CRP/FNR family cyclic AMP-dependent transcriptional regulator
MASLVHLAARVPTRILHPGDVLIAEGDKGGDLHVLIEGTLVVERDGVVLSTLSQPGTLIGEMSVLLGKPITADVKATAVSRVRSIPNAAEELKKDAELALRVAATVATRLDTTSALLVDLSREHSGKHEQGILGRIMTALHATSPEAAEGQRRDLFNDATFWPRGPM